MMSPPRHVGYHVLLLAALLASATAQPSNNDDYMSGQQVHVSTAMVALLAAVIAVFVFIACSTVYLRHCTGGAYAVNPADARTHTVHVDHTFMRQQNRRRPRGLDAGVVAAFPTMKYAEAKALRVGPTTTTNIHATLECAVCLSEFEDDDRLTMLPRCSHAFHPDCIGEWLAGHVTCPVCRCNLDPNHKDTTTSSSGELEQPSLLPHAIINSVSSEETSLRQDDGAAAQAQPPVAVVIDVVTEEEEEERMHEAVELQQIGDQRRAMRSSSRSGARRPGQLTRAHSTGHSLAVRLDRDMERFTLRLPDHVRREMLATVSEQHSRYRGRRVGEGSSRGGGGRSGPIGSRAARWQSLLLRTFSGKVSSFFSASRTMTVVSSEGGEVSSTSSSSRARGKRVAAVDAADDVPPVKGGGGGLRLVDRIGGGGGSFGAAKAGTTVPHEAAAPKGDEEKAVTQQVRT